MATYLSTAAMPPGEMVELTSPDQPVSLPDLPRLLAPVDPEIGYTTTTESDGW